MARIFDGEPTVIGHRGLGSGVLDGHAENTMSSYLAAVEAGLGWIELDVRRSADDELVLHHNSATPDGEFIIDRPAQATGLPGFAEVLAELPDGVGVDIDVKTEFEDAVDPADRRTGALLAPLLAQQMNRRPVFVSSFDPALLLYLQDNLPGLPVGLITWIRFPLHMAVPAAANLGMDAVCIDTRSFALEHGVAQFGRRPADYTFDMAHRAGLEVLVWCPDADEAVWFAEAGADALCVNDVPGVLAALGDRSSPAA